MADSSLGQVLIYKKWRYEDGTKGGLGITDPKKVPTFEDIEVAQAKVVEQGQIVRNLKEDQGLTNSVSVNSG